MFIATQHVERQGILVPVVPIATDFFGQRVFDHASTMIRLLVAVCLNGILLVHHGIINYKRKVGNGFISNIIRGGTA